MGFIRGVILFTFVLLTVPLYSQYFQMKGWEYDTRLTNKGKPVLAEDIYFIKSVVLNKKIFLFYRTRDSMSVSLFDNGRIIATKEAFPADEYTVPVIKEDSNSLVILAYYKGVYHFYRMTDVDNILPFHSFDYPLNFNYDFFILGNKILISLPTLLDGRYSIRILILEKKGWQYETKQMDLSSMDETDKGIFYFRIFKEQNKYSSYFIRRYYDSSAKVIGDSIFTFQITDLAQIKNAKPVMLMPYGFSDHPPEILPDKANTYILFTRKRGTVYSFRLLSDKNKIEYTVSKDFINSYYPRYFFQNSVLDFFYLGNLENNTQIYYRKIDLNRLNEMGYLETESSNVVATSPVARISAFTLCANGDDRYLFYVCENDRSIYFTRNDISAPSLSIDPQIKEEKNKLFYYFSWEKPIDPSGIAGYAYVVDKKPDTVPLLVNLSPADRLISTKFLEAGNYYLHVRAVDGLGNPGPVQHLRFEAGMKDRARLMDLFAQNQMTHNEWQDSIEKALNAIGRELSLSNNYALAEYSALLGYYKDISGNILEKNYPMAKKYLNRCVLINGKKMETSLYLQLIKKNEENIFYKNQMLVNIALFLALMIVLTSVYFGVSKL